MDNKSYDSIENAHIAILTRQRDALVAKVNLLSDIVLKVPSIIVSARMDQKEGKPTFYDYEKASRALHAPETF